MAQPQIKVPSVKLNNGLEMPVVAYGTWLGLNDKAEFDYTDFEKMVEALSYAIDIGYRHIDTAHLYRIEPEVGQVVNQKIKEGLVKREDLFITTKVWHNFHREKDVEVAVRDSLRRLNLDYVDLVLIHWPLSVSVEGVDEKIDYLETWRGCEAVLAKGLTKAIGISNFNVEQTKRIVANSKVKPAVNQVEINLNLGQNELVEYCQSEGIVVEAYSPFGTMVPSRATAGSPEPKLNNPTLVAIAKKYNKTVTQVTLRYLYQRGIVVLPKSVTKSRVLENALIFDFELDAEDMKTLAQFDNGYRTVEPLIFQHFSNYPFEKKDVKDLPPIPESLRIWKNGLGKNID